MERALRDGAGELLLLGALGGKLDQTLANLLILAQREWPCRCASPKAASRRKVLHGEAGVDLDGLDGQHGQPTPAQPG